jgi:hypothetical protein
LLAIRNDDYLKSQKTLRIDIDLQLEIAVSVRVSRVTRYRFFVLSRTPGASPLVNSTPASSSTR